MTAPSTVTYASGFFERLSPGGKYPPEAGRYILYVSLGCPFALRAAMTRAIKGLESVLEMCVTDYHYAQVGQDEEGKPQWGLQFTTADRVAACVPDPIMNARLLKELYERAVPGYTGAVTVPMLWDRKTGTIVNNDSLTLISVLNSDFGSLAKHKEVDLYPGDLDAQIKERIQWGMESIASASRLAGTATCQEDYDASANLVKRSLLELDQVLAESRFVLGSQITAADIVLFNVVIRHDIITVLQSRINHIFIRDLAGVMRWIKDILDIPGIRDIISIEHIKGLSFSKRSFNPTGIIPLGDGFVLPH